MVTKYTVLVRSRKVCSFSAAGARQLLFISVLWPKEKITRLWEKGVIHRRQWYNKKMIHGVRDILKTVGCIFVLTLISFLTIPKQHADALVASPLGGGFGGRVIIVRPCTCSFGFVQQVVTTDGIFMKIGFLTQVYNHHALLPGNWVLGFTAPGYVPCNDFPVCEDTGGGPAILGVGTSKTP